MSAATAVSAPALAEAEAGVGVAGCVGSASPACAGAAEAIVPALSAFVGPSPTLGFAIAVSVWSPAAGLGIGSAPSGTRVLAASVEGVDDGVMVAAAGPVPVESLESTGDAAGSLAPAAGLSVAAAGLSDPATGTICGVVGAPARSAARSPLVSSEGGAFAPTAAEASLPLCAPSAGRAAIATPAPGPLPTFSPRPVLPSAAGSARSTCTGPPECRHRRRRSTSWRNEVRTRQRALASERLRASSFLRPMPAGGCPGKSFRRRKRHQKVPRPIPPTLLRDVIGRAGTPVTRASGHAARPSGALTARRAARTIPPLFKRPSRSGAFLWERCASGDRAV